MSDRSYQMYVCIFRKNIGFISVVLGGLGTYAPQIKGDCCTYSEEFLLDHGWTKHDRVIVLYHAYLSDSSIVFSYLN